MRLLNVVVAVLTFAVLVLNLYVGSLLGMVTGVSMLVASLHTWARQEARIAIADELLEVVREQYYADAPEDYRKEFERLYAQRQMRRNSWWRG